MALEITEGFRESLVTGDVEDIAWLRSSLTVTRDAESIELFTGRQGCDWQCFVPSGLFAFVIQLCAKAEKVLKVTRLPARQFIECPKDILTGIELRDYQRIAVRKALMMRRGILNIATGGGKTEVFSAINKLLETHDPERTTSLTIVSSKNSAVQTAARFKARGLTSVGRFGEGKTVFEQRHIVAHSQALMAKIRKNDKQTLQLLREVVCINFDECHHLGSAPSWQTIANLCDAEFRFGFSGTPFGSGLPTVQLDNPDTTLADFRLTAATGDVIVYIPSKLLRDMGVLVNPRILVVPVNKPNLMHMPYPQWKTIYKKGISHNETRNDIITSLGYKLFKRGHRVCIVVFSIEHGLDLLKRFHSLDMKVAFSKGDTEVFVVQNNEPVLFKPEDLGEDEDPQLRTQKQFINGELDLLIGSVVYDESVDLPVMSALILAGGMKSPIRAIQRIGRSIRSADGKEEAVVIEFRDNMHFFLSNHTKKRLKIYDIHEYRYEEFTSLEEVYGALLGTVGPNTVRG